MRIKRFITLALAGVLSVAALAGCGSKEESGKVTTVKVGVVGSLYEDLWKPAQDKLKSEGITVELVQFSDYVTPNNALNAGEIDLNSFQHRIYLESEIKNYNYKIQNVGNTFIIPLNLYSNKVKSVSELKDGDTVAIPNDVTNGGRAIKVLRDAGLITLKDDANFSPTVADIESYKVNIKIEELAANTIPSALADVTAGIVNGNYALDFGLKTENAIFKDTSLSESQYWNLIAARTEDLQNPEKKAVYEKVVKAFQSQETEDVFNNKFGGYFIKEGWDEDLFNK
jgi:D-methionine transport system substrate-binding protein